MRSCFMGLVIGTLLATSVPAQAGTIPDIHVVVGVATEGPLSLWSAPDGSGRAFTEAYQPDGTQVDGTITMVLQVNSFGNYEPVPNYPFEDIWLSGEGLELAPCNGGTCPDADTDATGSTSWTQPLELGGHTSPALGEGVWVVVNGEYFQDGALPDLRLNSPDIDGNRSVNLSDVILFAGDFYGAYDYRSDFVWDGVLNLSDIISLAQALGANCP